MIGKHKNGTNKKLPRVVVAMSGGVDSSVAAFLLKREGFDVIGVFMKFWKDPSTSLGREGENRCCSLESEKLARQVAKKIGIPFYVLNAEKEFKKEVVDYFLSEYKKGDTPNPCVVCNREIKFGLLIKKSIAMGANFIATGHYATVKNNKLFKGIDKEKDQSYFLWQLNKNQLSKILFPVGGYTKTEVRNLAKKFKLPTAQTPESQEVCFISQTTNKFLKKHLKIKEGNIVDTDRKILGKHHGLWFYTIGQRRGLDIFQGPYYVIKKDYKKNELMVSKNEKDLLQKKMIAKNVSWIDLPKLPIKAKVKIRYKSNFASALIRANKGGGATVVFQEPQKAVTPGQSVVIYKGKELLGGGIIT